MERIAIIAIATMILPLGGPVRADQAQTTPGARTIDCYCRGSSGERIEMGEVLCLRVDGRSFLARCSMSLNTPMWREIEQGCVISGLFDPQPRLYCALPTPNALCVHPKV